MNDIYLKLNNKLDYLTNKTRKTKNTTNSLNTNTRVINLTQTHFNKEQLNILAPGPNYTIKKKPQTYINNLIVETENAIRKLDAKLQNPYKIIAATKTKQIIQTETMQHKQRKIQSTINEIREILHKDNLLVTKADKSNAMVIIEKETLNLKIEKFIQENNIIQVAKDPTKLFQAQVQQILQTSDK
jgi:hypothetical protein